MALFESFFGLIRKNKSPDVSYDFDELFSDLQQIHLKLLAIDKNAEFLSRVFSRSEFNYRVNDERMDNQWSYILNAKPNKNEAGSRFWQRLVYKLITQNEVLVILSDDDQLLIADAFNHKEYAVYGDVFESVVVKNYQFKRSFKMDEVIYLQYNNNRLSLYLDKLFEDYQKLYSRMVEALARNNQIRGTLKVKGANQFNKEQTQTLKNYSERLFAAFKDKSVAIVPMIDQIEYDELTNRVGVSDTSIDELKKLRRQFEDDVADLIGIPVALLHGEIAGIEDAQKSFNMYCLEPLIKRVEDELNSKIIDAADYQKGAKIEIIGVERRDLFELASSIDKLISSGAFNRNEVRKELGYTAIEGGDEFLITRNYQEFYEGKGGEVEGED
ncbi:phage portal protein [Streptococcus chenjunshii]|uniref:Phage portal protein n=1 Tax=Streptococcus chenjunshii TaxID=2173853 RepID=A0A372KLQ6_9STRE|nr:phage portal protein [Streptococcus chenjunshii]AXQ79431.1 phage portal protein [Streptococcus chenjunshii]RFU51112.1 phage portal protein [Streptococcus chenjunshii]RFU53210.1 phage portal protein [Streptococcus chenjunshii]